MLFFTIIPIFSVDPLEPAVLAHNTCMVTPTSNFFLKRNTYLNLETQGVSTTEVSIPKEDILSSDGNRINSFFDEISGPKSNCDMDPDDETAKFMGDSPIEDYALNSTYNLQDFQTNDRQILTGNRPNISVWDSLKKTTKLAGPICLINSSYTIAAYVHAAMFAKLEFNALAAGSLITSMQNFVEGAYWCALSAVAILVAREQNAQRINIILSQGLTMAMIIGIGTLPFTLSYGKLLHHFGIEKELADIVQSYFFAYSWGFPALALLSAAQQVRLGVQSIFAYAISMVSWSCMTTGLGYGLMFGKLGMPKLGATGLGHASSIVAWVNLIAFFTYLKFVCNFPLSSLTPCVCKPFKENSAVLKELFNLGIPFAAQNILESAGMVISNYMIGRFTGTEGLSANQIASQYIFLSLFPSYGISQSASILVGDAIKDGNLFNAKRLGNTSIALGSALSIALILIGGTMLETLISAFIDIDDSTYTNTVNTARTMLMIGGGRITADALRIISGSALQAAFKDSVSAMVIGAFSTLIAAIPLGYTLAMPAGMGASGFHLAPAIGIGIGGSALFYRWHKKISKLIEDEKLVQSPTSFPFEVRI